MILGLCAPYIIQYQSLDKMKKLSYLVLLIVLFVCSRQQCGQTASDLIQTDSTLFYNGYAGSSKRDHVFQITITFVVPARGVEITASSSSLTQSTNVGTDFLIIASPGNNPNVATVLLLINQDRTWQFIRVQYLISGRSDFYVGTFSADTYLRQTIAGSSIALSQTLPNWQSGLVRYNVIALLSGLKTSASTFSAVVGNVNFNSQSGVLSVFVNLVSSPAFERVSISYVIFAQTAPFAYSRFIPLRPSTATHNYYGIEQMNNGNAEYSGHAFISQRQNLLQCQGVICPTSCVTSSQCVGLQGNAFNNYCIICGPQQYYESGQCKQRTQACGNNQRFDGANCVCNPNYIMVNNVCFFTCGRNAYIRENQCLCIPGFALSQITQTCTEIQTIGVTCGINFVVVGNRCVCRQGYGLVNNSCVICPANSDLSSNGQCICRNGFTLHAQTLSCNPECPLNSNRNAQGVCICISGLVLSVNQCIPQNFGCPPTQVWNGQRCICQAGLFPDFNSGNCSFCNSVDRMVQNGICTCSRLFFPTLDGCSACRNDSLYDRATRRCLCNNGFTEINGQCRRNVSPTVCPFETTFNPATNKCECQQFQFYLIDGICQPCTVKSFWNGNNCECIAGYTWKNRICDIVCPTNSVQSGINCICNTGLFLIGDTNSRCLACDPNTFYVDGKKMCYCKDGFFGTFDKCNACHPTCASCSGAGQNQCHSCSGNRILTFERNCLSPCGEGNYLEISTTTCRQCSINCASCNSQTTCLACKTGFSLKTSTVSGQVIIDCASTVVSNVLAITLRSNVIGNGVVYQGVSLNFIPSGILISNCAICDDLLLVEIVSSVTNIQSKIEYVKNSQYNFIISFNLGAVAFIPGFQFRIRIKNTYTGHFTTADMSLSVQSSITSNQPLSFSSLSIAPNPTSTIFTSGATIIQASALPPAQSNPELLAKLFQ